MRIISGEFRGRRLETPKGNDPRPTADMIKESVFNIIQFEIQSARVLDLFCGTGQMGLEALSRGAEHCVFVDASAPALELARRNIKLCGVSERADTVRTFALSYLNGIPENHFDIIFIDPPYDTDLTEKTVRRILEFDKLRDNGIMVCETRADYVLPDAPEPRYARREYRYGKIKITLYRKNAD